jgi:hypothetical protein
MTPTVQGEVQFRRWSDSSTQGVQITFALPDSEDLEPLKAKAGKRFMAVLVEIGDDEQPVQPAPRKDTRGPLCREACELCKMPEFQKWTVARLNSTTVDRVEQFDADSFGEERSKEFILDTCEIESRKELDSHQAAAHAFIQFIRIPFMRYMKTRQAA